MGQPVISYPIVHGMSAFSAERFLHQRVKEPDALPGARASCKAFILSSQFSNVLTEPWRSPRTCSVNLENRAVLGYLRLNEFLLRNVENFLVQYVYSASQLALRVPTN